MPGILSSLRRLTAMAGAGGIVVAGLTACAGTPHPAASHRAVSARRRPAVTAQPIRPELQASPQTSAPQGIHAVGAAIADPATMQLLWSRELDTEHPIGSIAKVMTALVVIQAGDLNREIRIPTAVLQYVAKFQGESAGLRPGDVLSTQELLEALLLQSGCDAAYVLAMSYGPGMPAFLAKMNATAQQLGMTHTVFTSPDGLPYPTEYSTYSTPADLLKLGMAAMKSSVFRSIVVKRFYQLAKSRIHHAYWWGNTNALIGSYQGADGIKTGYTDAAKHCLLFEATRHGTTLIGVVLGSPATGPDAAAVAAAGMLNWGFGLKIALGGQAAPPP